MLICNLVKQNRIFRKLLLGFTALDSDVKFPLVLHVTHSFSIEKKQHKLLPQYSTRRKKSRLQYPPSYLLEDDRISASIGKNKENLPEK